MLQQALAASASSLGPLRKGNILKRVCNSDAELGLLVDHGVIEGEKRWHPFAKEWHKDHGSSLLYEREGLRERDGERGREREHHINST